MRCDAMLHGTPFFAFFFFFFFVYGKGITSSWILLSRSA